MEESFQLLSTMSPKVKEGYKVTKKGSGTSVLALKKHFRRSSILDNKKRTTPNDSLVIISSSSSSDLSSIPNKNTDVTTIEISDSDVSEDEALQTTEPNRRTDFKKNIQADLDAVEIPLSRQKVHDIHDWIKNLDIADKTDCTTFSEVSTIFGDEVGGNFKMEGQAYAVNSTQIDNGNRRFDEMFMQKKIEVIANSTVYNFKKGSQEPQNVDNKGLEQINESMGNMCIDDNLLRKNMQHRRSSGSRKSENIKLSIEGTNTDDKQEQLEEYEKILDELYGNSWRANREQVLPKTEPKKRTKKLIAENNLPNTERKKLPKSPWVEKLKHLCDNSSSDGSPIKRSPVKQRLNFDDDGKTSKYFTSESNKENIPKVVQSQNKSNSLLRNLQTENVKKNFPPPWVDRLKGLCDSSASDDGESDFSDLGESLEERIKKKKVNVKPKRSKKIEVRYDDNFGKYRSPSSSVSSSSGDGDGAQFSQSVDLTKRQKKSWTFLESLSGQVPIDKCEMSARIFRNNFKVYKNELAQKLFKLYNDDIFDNCIPSDTPIEWNERMRGTAGYCYCKKITRRAGTIDRSARIVLSTKVIDSADRLRDTLVHELCHAATWIVNHVSDGHGPYWKAWANKAMQRFPELPPIKRCHEYVINTKYTYKCVGCGYSIGRHSKSLDIERKRCGYCLGKFEVLINKTSKQGEIKSVPVTPRRQPSAFAQFVKENYAQCKSPMLKHGEVMKLLGQKFAQIKTAST